MENSALFYFSYLLPATSISCICLLFIYKLYYRIRSSFTIFVNCWFCNENTKVRFSQRNSWVCPNSVCQQYNGFTIEGDYNKPIGEQFNSKNLVRDPNIVNQDNLKVIAKVTSKETSLCKDCNKNQFFKIEKLSQFEPKTESNYENDFKKYKQRIEETYRLCPNCERNVWEILREKKKMILGSKFFASIVKGIGTKYPEMKAFNSKHKIKKSEKLKTVFKILAIINMFFMIKEMKMLNNFLHFINVPPFTSIITHTILLSNTIKNIAVEILNNNFLNKLYLFTKFISTFFLKYFGIKMPGFQINYYTCVHFIIPICGILLAFVRNVIDQLRVKHVTALLTAWSIHFGVLNIEYFNEADTLKILTAIVVLIFSIPKINNGYLRIDTGRNNFHKIYFDDVYQEKPVNVTFNNIKNDFRLVKSNFNITPQNCNVKRDRSFSNFKTNNLRLENFGLCCKHLQESSSHSLNSNIKDELLTCGNGIHNFSNRNKKSSRLINNYENFYKSSDIRCNNFIWKPSFLNAKQKLHTKDKIYSPFHQYSALQQNRTSLITPSRFCSKSYNFECGTKSWISGGFFNSGQQNTATQGKHLISIMNKNLNNSDKFSRASSKSSGFESNSSSLQDVGLISLTANDSKIKNHSNHNFYSQKLNNKQSNILSSKLPKCFMHSLDNEPIILEDSTNLPNHYMPQNTDCIFHKDYEFKKQKSL